MSSEYRYKLEKGSKKHTCPGCNKKRFVRYIDTVTGNYLSEKYGRCDRESKCSYHLNPYLDGYGKAQETNKTKWIPKSKPRIKKPPEPVYFDFETFEKTLSGYEKNSFIQNLLTSVPFPFLPEDVIKVIELYRLGTIKKGYRAKAITFPFIDVSQNVRTIQVKQFDKNNHTTGTDFLHSILEKFYKRNKQSLPGWLQEYLKQDKRVSCLFGEHLLMKYPINPIALVEAPKTAIYGNLYFGFPEQAENFLWLAVYNKSSFSLDRLKVLQGRSVYVFPDLSKDGNTFKEWKQKAEEYKKHLPGTTFIFSDLLERMASQTDREQGNDIADILSGLDWRQFQEKEKRLQPEPPQRRPQKNPSINLRPLNWKHLLKIPQGIKIQVVKERTRFKTSKEELQRKFNLSIEEINLILYPNGKGLSSY